MSKREISIRACCSNSVSVSGDREAYGRRQTSPDGAADPPKQRLPRKLAPLTERIELDFSTAVPFMAVLLVFL
jgi:hypothetical protein